MLVGLFLGANVFTILLMWLIVASTYVSPHTYPTLSLIGLFFPIFVIVDIAFIFFWLIFRFSLIWVPIMGLAAVAGYAMDYCPINTREYASDSAICVVTYNLGGVKEEEDRREVIRFLREKSPDIVCFQEIAGNLINMPEFLQLTDSMGYHRVIGHAKYLLTRFPVCGDTLHIDYPTRHNSSIACWILCQGDSLLLVSNHLESNALTDSDKTEYKSMILEPEQQRVEQGSRLLARKLRDAAYYRGTQTDTLCALIDRNAGKSIIMCGDFNDTPISYTYQRLARRLNCAFRETGRGVGFTYKRSGIYVRIDHIFASDDWKCLKCYVDDGITASDHFPVVAYLQKKHR
ncbi:MAG: endonuclease/exonuclease/phosphatase family protein [Bacteroidaceae bacterium]|nr:endonuclease/exonuclease/phosphatase family protein [Bacteroidaceae bacterium]